MNKATLGFSIGAVAVSVLLIIFLATGFWTRFFFTPTEEHQESMFIMPQETNLSSGIGGTGQLSWEESLNTKIPLEEGETVIAVINREVEGIAEEQFVAYIRSSGSDRRVYITYIGFDDLNRRYVRLWNAPTAATRPETISFFSQDLIGDRNNCIVVTGMNNRNEHTMTILRRSFYRPVTEVFNTIAEIQIDGSIIVQETARSLAYQQGMAIGESYNIAAYGQDRSSRNILDQIETIYSFNPVSEQYEQTSIARIPGSQIEQRRLGELLSGAPGVFEEFINDLWYYVSPQGTIDAEQYLYFDPSGREIIFYGDEAQQVFHWQSSSPTRYGIYIRSQNISISTLLRFIDIELESLDSIKLRVIEDVRLKIAASTNWDGSYRRASSAVGGGLNESVSSIKPAIDAVYDSSWGRIQFNSANEYTISSGNTIRSGRYVLFNLDDKELLELRPNEGNDTSSGRMVYRIETIGHSMLILSRVRLGTSGVQELFEPPVTLTPVEN